MTTSPWTGAQSRASAIVSAGGLLAASWCWWGAAGESDLPRQYGWVAGAAVSVGVVAVASAVWLRLGRRAVVGRSRTLLDRCGAQTPKASGSALPPAPTARPDGVVLTVIAAGMRHHHRADCQFVKNKATTAAPSIEHDEAGYERCPVCLP